MACALLTPLNASKYSNAQLSVVGHTPSDN